jgi:hypothetical protein
MKEIASPIEYELLPLRATNSSQALFTAGLGESPKGGDHHCIAGVGCFTFLMLRPSAFQLDQHGQRALGADLCRTLASSAAAGPVVVVVVALVGARFR